jgi:hypothetical protein
MLLIIKVFLILGTFFSSNFSFGGETRKELGARIANLSTNLRLENIRLDRSAARVREASAKAEADYFRVENCFYHLKQDSKRQLHAFNRIKEATCDVQMEHTLSEGGGAGARNVARKMRDQSWKNYLIRDLIDAELHTFSYSDQEKIYRLDAQFLVAAEFEGAEFESFCRLKEHVKSIKRNILATKDQIRELDHQEVGVPKDCSREVGNKAKRDRD